MRTVILISAVVLALSSAAPPRNAQITELVDIVNTTQNGAGNNGNGITQNWCSRSFQRNATSVGRFCIFGANATSV